MAAGGVEPPPPDQLILTELPLFDAALRPSLRLIELFIKLSRIADIECLFGRNSPDLV
jgi:hypothetical protein